MFGISKNMFSQNFGFDLGLLGLWFSGEKNGKCKLTIPSTATELILSRALSAHIFPMHIDPKKREGKIGLLPALWTFSEEKQPNYRYRNYDSENTDCQVHQQVAGCC